MPSTIQEGYVRLARAASLARRPGVVLVQDDLDGLIELAGSRAEAHAVIAALERQGRIRPVRRGVYVLVDTGGGIRLDVLDLVAALTPKPYLVTAGRALQFHGLSDQHYRRVLVLVSTQLRPWTWRGDEVRYVRTSRSFRGDAARTRRTKAQIATAERAIADSLDHPSWGVPLSQVVQAIATVLDRDSASADKLAAEAAHAGSHSLARRLGFIVSRLAGSDAARPFLPLRGESKASTPLRAGGQAGGRIDRIWRVRENVDLQQLLQH
jgi:predicted transcriptional regulator of viral defense system